MKWNKVMGTMGLIAGIGIVSIAILVMMRVSEITPEVREELQPYLVDIVFLDTAIIVLIYGAYLVGEAVSTLKRKEEEEEE